MSCPCMNKGKTPAGEEEEETGLSRRGYEAYRPGRGGSQHVVIHRLLRAGWRGLIHNFKPRCHTDARLKGSRAPALAGTFHSCP